MEWFERNGVPEHILLTNRHHPRHSWRFRDAFGCEGPRVRSGLHELEGRGPVQPFDFGAHLPVGAVVHEVDAISPDEAAFYLAQHGALACADGVIRAGGNGELAFVPDSLMDEPEQTKRGLLDAYQRLLELD